VALGWAVPEVPVEDQTGVLLAPVQDGGPVYYLWDHGEDNSEFFLMENRQQLAGTYDEYLPGNGLLVWHIDEDMPNNNSQIIPGFPPNQDPLRHNDCSWPSHYLVALQQADGFMNLEMNPNFNQGNQGDVGDPYPYLEVNAFTPTSTEDFFRTPPNSGSYADCGSLVEITNITEEGILTAAVSVNNIRLDLTVGGPPPPEPETNENVLVIRRDLLGDRDILAADWVDDMLLDPEDRGDLGEKEHIYIRGDVDGDGLRDLVRGRILDPWTVEWNVHIAFVFGGATSYFDSLSNPWHPDLGSKKSRFFLGDVDGDGLEDLVFTDRAYPATASHGWTPTPPVTGVWVALSDGDSFGEPVEWASGLSCAPCGGLFVGDVDGDEKADLVQAMKSFSAPRTLEWQVALSDGSSFGDWESWGETPARPLSKFLLGDVSGDGRDDIVFSVPPPWRSRRYLDWQAALSAGDHFMAPALWLEGFGRWWQRFGLTDIDSDGLFDLLAWQRWRGEWIFDAALSEGSSFTDLGEVGIFEALWGDKVLP